MRILLIFIFLFTCCDLVQVYSDIFQKEKEFPNHFLPENFSKLSIGEQEAVISEQRLLLEKAVQSKMQRLTVPIATPGENTIKRVRYFPYIQSAMESIAPEARVMPSGGVVRSVLGSIYDDLHKAYLNNPKKFDANIILKKIASETDDVDAIDVRGVGSDFDILVQNAGKKKEEVLTEILRITNSAVTFTDSRANTNQFKRVLFTIGDVMEYEEQIKRSTNQGGSTIDFLAFDPKSGKFVEPESHPYIVKDFIKAQYRYIAPVKGVEVASAQKQLIRGIRPLVEMPFIEMHEPEQFLKELEQFSTQVTNDKNMDSKAIEQVGKMVRNSRYALGNNRIIRANGSTVEGKIRSFFDLLNKNEISSLPEFVDYDPLQLRDKKKKELNGFPRELLADIGDVIERHTTDGKIYHGTPNIDNAMAIMRGGMFYSGGRYEQGRFAEGGGGYAAGSKDNAISYPNGHILELKLKRDSRLNIILWDEKVETHPFIVNAKKRSVELGIDLHQYLRRFHGIDLIKKYAFLILNAEAVILGDTKARVRSLIDSIVDTFRTKKKIGALTRLEALLEYQKLASYAQSIGISLSPIDAKIFRSINKHMNESIKHSLDNSSSLIVINDITKIKYIISALEKYGNFGIAISSENIKLAEQKIIAGIELLTDARDYRKFIALANNLQKDWPQEMPQLMSAINDQKQRLIDKLLDNIRSKNILIGFQAALEILVTEGGKKENSILQQAAVDFLKKHHFDVNDLKDIKKFTSFYKRLMSKYLQEATRVEEWFDFAKFNPDSSFIYSSSQRDIAFKNIDLLYSLDPSKKYSDEQIKILRHVLGDYLELSINEYHSSVHPSRAKYPRRSLYKRFLELYPRQAKELDDYLIPQGDFFIKYAENVIRDPKISMDLKLAALSHIFLNDKRERVVDRLSSPYYLELAKYIGREKFIEFFEVYRNENYSYHFQHASAVPADPLVGYVDSEKMSALKFHMQVVANFCVGQLARFVRKKID